MNADEPIPQDGEASQHFIVCSDGAAKLKASRCVRCAGAWFPARSGCGACGSTAMEDFLAGPDATVYASTAVHVGARGFETPYALSYLDVEDLRVLAHVRTAVGGQPASPPPGTAVRLFGGSIGSTPPQATFLAIPVAGQDHEPTEDAHA